MKTRLSLALATLFALSCIHTVHEDPRPPVTLPEAFAQGSGGEVGADRWWEAFQDPELNRIVEKALEGNLEMFGAWARIDQANAIAIQARSAWYPNLSANADYGYNRSVFFAGDLGKLEQETHNYNLGLGMSYEVDIWGKIKSMVDASDRDVEATRQDLESMAMTLVAQVTEVWFSLVEMEAQMDLLQRQIEINRTYRDLVEARFGQGMATALDVFQQRQQVEAVRAQMPQVEAGLHVLRHQLAVLLGKPPSEKVAHVSKILPVPPPLPTTGLPADVIGNRPDVKSAQLRVVSTDHRIGMAKKDMLPSFRLNFNVGFTAQDITQLFDNWIFGLGAGLLAPLLDGGRRLAEVDRVIAQRLELIGRYGQVVLNALKEVEDALVQERKQLEYLEGLQGQLDVVRSALEVARDRYAGGLIDYLPVLTALQSVQAIERSELTARRQALSYRIQLCRAIGGDWTGELERPEPPYEKDPAEQAGEGQ
ncbi:MAG: TolC family protein [Deltaproteobacteria bacterium]|nr:TolC family protein [Deltaproteobacteria bacterium]